MDEICVSLAPEATHANRQKMPYQEQFADFGIPDSDFFRMESPQANALKNMVNVPLAKKISNVSLFAHPAKVPACCRLHWNSTKIMFKVSREQRLGLW
jgi:hypothetical protein